MRRTRLARGVEILRPGLLAQSEAHHRLEAVLDVLDRFGLGHLFAQHHHGKFLYHLAAAQDGLDEARAEEFAVVGNAVVEGDRRDGRDLGLVADAHPREGGLGPVRPVFLRHADARRGVAADGYLEVFGHADAVDALHELARIVVVEAVDEGAHADVERLLENLRHGDHAAAARAPVGVAHLASVHFLDAAAHIDHIGHLDVAVVHAHEEGHGLEHGAGLEEVADGLGAHLLVGAVIHAREARHGLDVARGHLHEDAYAVLGLDFAELVAEGLFADVLHLHVERGHHVAAVLGGAVNDAEVAVEHLLAVCDAGLAAEHGVEGHLEARAGGVLSFIERADGPDGEGAVGVLARLDFLHVEAADVGRLAEDGEGLALAVLDVAHALLVEGPVVALALAAFEQVLPELGAVDVGEDAGHAPGYGVGLVEEHGVAQVLFLGAAGAVLLPRHVVHEELVLGDGCSQHLPAGSEDVASGGGHGVVFLHKAVAHGHPVVFLHGHGVECLADDGKAGEDEHGGDEGISLGNLFGRKVHNAGGAVRRCSIVF